LSCIVFFTLSGKKSCSNFCLLYHFGGFPRHPPFPGSACERAGRWSSATASTAFPSQVRLSRSRPGFLSSRTIPPPPPARGIQPSQQGASQQPFSSPGNPPPPIERPQQFVAFSPAKGTKAKLKIGIHPANESHESHLTPKSRIDAHVFLRNISVHSSPSVLGQSHFRNQSCLPFVVLFILVAKNSFTFLPHLCKKALVVRENMIFATLAPVFFCAVPVSFCEETLARAPTLCGGGEPVRGSPPPTRPLWVRPNAVKQFFGRPFSR